MRELPHGAYVDAETNTLHLSLGSITLNFNFEEWGEFIKMIDDINIVFQSNVEESLYQCEACGTVNAVIAYVEPEEDEFN
jgi:hypothetical protein|tara:strand:- start:1286 stop:1525 length:240 start_codon:yes stop_codon:yes gene_type:complete